MVYRALLFCPRIGLDVSKMGFAKEATTAIVETVIEESTTSYVQKGTHLYPVPERGTFLRNGTGVLYIFSGVESKVKER